MPEILGRLVEAPGLAHQPGARVEARLQAALQQPRQPDLKVGDVAVVEGDHDLRPPDRGVEQSFELLDRDPDLVLAVVQRARRYADPVDIDVDDPPTLVRLRHVADSPWIWSWLCRRKSSAYRPSRAIRTISGPRSP